MSAPTSYYYSARVEMFLRDASKALAQGKKEEHKTLIMRATHYEYLAGQLPLLEGRTDEQNQDIHKTQVL